jgi:hypothetical protein
MSTNLHKFAGCAAAILFIVLFSSTLATAQGGLKTINPPQGGKIVYGQVDGQTTEAGAMGAVLRSLHNSLGEKPQVGKLFDVKGTDSVATFFTVTRHDQGAGKGSLAIQGMLIATKVSSDHVEAALVSDDASRFNKTLPAMMKTLMSVWHPFKDAEASGGNVSGGNASGSSSPVPQLHQVVTQDRSAAISVPDGWQLLPGSGGGTLIALGPHNESAEMDSTFLTADTNNAHVQQTMRTVQNGGLRNTAYAKAFYYPYGGNQAKTFVDVLQNSRRRGGLPVATYNIANATPLPVQGQQHCTHLTGTVDYQDGKGVREMNAVYCVNPPGPFGNWMSFANVTTAPQQFAAAERDTLSAVMESFKFDNKVVQGEAARYAAPSIHNSIAIGDAVRTRVNAAHQAEDIHNSSVYQHWDSIDRRSQEFGNYQLGYAVVSTTDNTAHGTLWADDAAALVQNNPDRYEYVSAPNYWKGIDY